MYCYFLFLSPSAILDALSLAHCRTITDKTWTSCKTHHSLHSSLKMKLAWKDFFFWIKKNCAKFLIFFKTSCVHFTCLVFCGSFFDNALQTLVEMGPSRPKISNSEHCFVRTESLIQQLLVWWKCHTGIYFGLICCLSLHKKAIMK